MKLSEDSTDWWQVAIERVAQILDDYYNSLITKIEAIDRLQTLLSEIDLTIKLEDPSSIELFQYSGIKQFIQNVINSL